MKIIEPYILIPILEISSDKVVKLERYSRVCYKSEEKMVEDSSHRFIHNIISSGHESVIEHEKATILIVTDRGVTHEIVRHRIGSYSQESTRYCNYTNNNFGGEITVIKPFFYEENRSENLEAWSNLCKCSEETYNKLVANGKPQEARAVLPNSLKTEIVVTFNFREWRHFFKLRCSPKAHPQMRQIAIPLLIAFKEALHPLFDDIEYDKSFNPSYYAKVIKTDEYFYPIKDGDVVGGEYR